jgi:hypothetical protein
MQCPKGYKMNNSGVCIESLRSGSSSKKRVPIRNRFIQRKTAKKRKRLSKSVNHNGHIHHNQVDEKPSQGQGTRNELGPEFWVNTCSCDTCTPISDGGLQLGDDPLIPYDYFLGSNYTCSTNMYTQSPTPTPGGPGLINDFPNDTPWYNKCAKYYKPRLYPTDEVAIFNGQTSGCACECVCDETVRVKYSEAWNQGLHGEDCSCYCNDGWYTWDLGSHVHGDGNCYAKCETHCASRPRPGWMCQYGPDQSGGTGRL